MQMCPPVEYYTPKKWEEKKAYLHVGYKFKMTFHKLPQIIPIWKLTGNLCPLLCDLSTSPSLSLCVYVYIYFFPLDFFELLIKLFR